MNAPCFAALSRPALALMAALALCAASPAGATPGGVDADGCHNSKKAGYHCHPERARASDRSVSSQETKRERNARLKRECKGQRNAGACLGYGSF